MTDQERLEAVLGAVSAAMVGDGEDLVVDLERLENGLAGAGISCTSTTNRGALTAELSFIRDELRTQRVRLEHAEGESRRKASELVDSMEAREAEVERLLWKK